jgi:hypothetical protein
MRRAPELWAALAAVALITALYRGFAGGPASAPGALLGHGLGVVGFLLMLATEVLYPLRKRLGGGGWGPMRTWLRAHIFTGIVGPYLVLLHGSWALGGLAGWTLLATVVVVVSGFVGRYLYTAVPPSEAGAARVRRWLALWHVVHVPLGMVLFTLAFAHVGAAIYYAATLR